MSRLWVVVLFGLLLSGCAPEPLVPVDGTKPKEVVAASLKALRVRDIKTVRALTIPRAPKSYEDARLDKDLSNLPPIPQNPEIVMKGSKMVLQGAVHP